MQLLLIIDNLSSGGAQRQITTLGSALAARGHQVSIFVYGSGDFFADRLRAAGVEILLSEKRSRWSTKPVWALRRLFREREFDVALSFLDTPNLYNLLAGVANQARPPVIVSERFVANSDNRTWLKWLIESCYPLADCLVVNSYHMQAYYQQRLPRMRDRVEVIWNGVDLTQFHPLEQPPARQAGPLRLLAVGRMTSYKNWDRLAAALAELRKGDPLEVTIDWVGRLNDLPAADQAYQRQIEQTLEQGAVTDRWNWLGERKEIAEMMRQYDALAHPSFCEGLPNVICEALSSGLPVLASDTLDHPRLVKSGERGLLFDWREPAQIAESIREFAGWTQAARQACSLAARQFAEEELSVEKFILRYEQLFASVAETAAH